MQLSLELVFFFILIVWLAAITFFFWKMRNQYQLFLSGSEKQSLSGFLEHITHNLADSKKTVSEMSLRLTKLEKENLVNIQKIGLLRYNPFRDTGGDQSFVLALTDAEDTGVVISALFSRSGTRWYAKRVVRGKGEEYELSDEEEKAVKLAKNSKKP